MQKLLRSWFEIQNWALTTYIPLNVYLQIYRETLQFCSRDLKRTRLAGTISGMSMLSVDIKKSNWRSMCDIKFIDIWLVHRVREILLQPIINCAEIVCILGQREQTDMHWPFWHWIIFLFSWRDKTVCFHSAMTYGVTLALLLDLSRLTLAHTAHTSHR